MNMHLLIVITIIMIIMILINKNIIRNDSDHEIKHNIKKVKNKKRVKKIIEREFFNDLTVNIFCKYVNNLINKNATEFNDLFKIKQIGLCDG